MAIAFLHCLFWHTDFLMSPHAEHFFKPVITHGTRAMLKNSMGHLQPWAHLSHAHASVAAPPAFLAAFTAVVSPRRRVLASLYILAVTMDSAAAEVLAFSPTTSLKENEPERIVSLSLLRFSGRAGIHRHQRNVLWLFPPSMPRLISCLRWSHCFLQARWTPAGSAYPRC